MRRTLAALALGAALSLGAVPAHGADLPASPSLLWAHDMQVRADAWLTYQGEWMPNDGCRADFEANYFGTYRADEAGPVDDITALKAYGMPGYVHLFTPYTGLC